ncbi:MAG: lamin tail domain-containing protein [Phycisphaerales bacterium]|nr:lamin tail domain-containing protein [Phycisphaerales bacterium]
MRVRCHPVRAVAAAACPFALAFAAVAAASADTNAAAVGAVTARAGAAGPVVAEAGAGRIVITEIMYNPASDEKRGEPEWVEIANVGGAPVAMDGWRLDDEDARKLDDWGTFTVTLAPGEVAVLINGDAVAESEFRTAWDDPSNASVVYKVLAVSWGGISNNPSATNEVLRLLDGDGNTVCEANLRNGDGWPRLSPIGGASVYLVDTSATDLNVGSLWKASEPGVSGARVCRPTAVFNGRDIGSPGWIPLPTPAAGAVSDRAGSVNPTFAVSSHGARTASASHPAMPGAG